MKTVYKVHSNGNLIIKTESKSEAKKVYDELKPSFPFGSTLSVCKEVNGESLGVTLLEFKD